MKTLKQSLRKKPTYNELVNYIEEDIPIRYPDRTATFLRNSHYLSQFDGDTFIDLEEQEKNIEKEKLKEAEVKKLAAETGTTAQAVRMMSKPNIFDRPEQSEAVSANITRRQAPKLTVSQQAGPKLNVSMLFDTGYDSGVDAYMSDMEEEEQRQLDSNIRKANERAAMGSRAVSEVSEQEQRSYPSYSFLATPDRPSAPPASTYATPIAPRRLEEEFKTPSSNKDFKDTLRKKQEESSSKKKAIEAKVEREKKAQEARAKAIAKKEEEHKKTLEQLSAPYQSSSSKLEKDEEEETRLDETTKENLSQKEKKVYWKHVISYNDDIKFWEGKDKTVKDLEYQFHLRGKSNLLPNESEYKTKGKGREGEITYKQAILLVIESLIKKKKWDAEVSNNLLDERMASWKGKGKGKSSSSSG